MSKSRFEEALYFEVNQFKDSQLKEAALYALKGEAKRARPLIAWMIAKELDPDYENFHPMIALELAHTSSLILDDLPSMDNANERRGKASLHLAFNEQEAVLTAVGLISESYRQLHKAIAKLSAQKPKEELLEILMHALENTASAGNLEGAPLGQWMDLTIQKMPQHDIKEMILKKTGVFFETAFVLGWLFGGGEIGAVKKVQQAAQSFGLLFQIIDDFFDYDEDLQDRAVANFVIQNGKEKALAFIEEEKERFEALLTELGLIKLQQALLQALESPLLASQSSPCC